MPQEPKSKNLTPEERLFKVIQETESAEDEASSAVASVFHTPALGLASGGSSPGHSAGSFFSIRAGNGILLAALAAFLIYFVLNQMFFSKPLSDKFMAKAEGVHPPALEAPTSLFTVEEMNQNSQSISQRNIFQPWRAEPPRPAVQAQPAAPSNALSDIAKSLKLTGIYQADQNEALIEAVDEKKTYNVKAGDPFKGVKIKEVKSGGVVLTDGTAEYFLQ